MSRFQFVADNSATFEVKRLCELVEIERSSYYAWKAGCGSPRIVEGFSMRLPGWGPRCSRS